MAFFECNHNNTIRPINNLLIANRGEVAGRIAKTARSYAISPRGIYSDADRDLAYINEMDLAFSLGGSHPTSSYLDIQKVIRAAIAMECDAVAPGYGFLSESASFAEAILDAGLTFVGPPPRIIADLGSKSRAKEIASSAGVPVLDSVIITPQSTLDRGLLEKITSTVEAPYLIKAVFGGGGRGMRLVRSEADLLLEVEAARREAKAAFGDGTLYVESYIEEPRHIEVQIIGDNYGNVATLFERECSIQRRFQKVIEEAPSPSIDDEVRSGLFNASLFLAQAIGYSNLGTAEFVVTKDNRFFFLEVNTRLQVEHRVTEAITGLDLVGLQFEMAMGYSLPKAIEEVVPHGHAIEARIYGESTEDGFTPSSGKIQSIDLGYFDTVDQSYFNDDEVSIYYDSMIAKVVSVGPTRDQAIDKLTNGLFSSHVAGISTNLSLLREISQDSIFQSGVTSTGYIGELIARTKESSASRLLPEETIPAAIYFIDRANKSRSHLRHLPISYRNLPSSNLSLTLLIDETEVVIHYACDRKNRIIFDLEEFSKDPIFFKVDESAIVVESKGLRRRYGYRSRDDVLVIEAPRRSSAFTKVPSISRKAQVAQGSLTTKMAGTIIKVMVSIGDRVKAGDVIAVIEAMKIEQPIVSPVDGVVEELYVTLNQRIDRGVTVVKIGP